MNKEFIPYEEALELKELGFNEPCLSYFDVREEQQLGNFDFTEINDSYIKSKSALSPLYQQAFRWFREKGYRYTISSDCFEKNGMFYFEAWKHKQFTFDSGLVYSTYEEAELACLKKLIEIVKGGDK